MFTSNETVAKIVAATSSLAISVLVMAFAIAPATQSGLSGGMIA